MRARTGGLLVLVAILVVLPYHLNLYWVHVADVALIEGLLALGLALTMGIAGQVNLAQVAFFGTGAYASAVLTTHGLGFWVAGIVSLLAAMLVAVLVSVPALRIQSHYLGIVTLGLALAFTNAVTNWSLTGQADGLNNLVAPRFPGVDLSSDYLYYYLILVALLLGLVWAGLLVHTRLGRRLRAMRDDSLAAASIGAETPYLRMTAFVLGGLFGGVAGVLYAGLIRFVSPESFSLSSMFFLLAGVIIGGRFSLLGAVTGAVFLVILREDLANYSVYARLLYGALVVLIVVFAPAGLVGLPRRLWGFLGARGWLPPIWRVPGVHLAAHPYRPRHHSSELAMQPGPMRDAVLQVEGVTKRFRGLTALDAVGMTVYEGEIRGIVGPNGSGKTTLFNIVSGIYAPTSGRVVLCDTDVTGIPAYRVAQRGVARTFQNLRLFSRLTVRENVLAALDGTRTMWAWRYLLTPWAVLRTDLDLRRQANGILSCYGLLDVAESLPGVLSYGTQRRVEIARAMAHSPRVLLLDEPAAGLNGEEVRQLAEIVRDVRSLGVTVILIEHNMSLVMSLCDRVTVLSNGKVIADGEPSSVANDPQVVTAYLGAAPQTAQTAQTMETDA